MEGLGSFDRGTLSSEESGTKLQVRLWANEVDRTKPDYYDSVFQIRDRSVWAS